MSIFLFFSPHNYQVLLLVSIFKQHVHATDQIDFDCKSYEKDSAMIGAPNYSIVCRIRTKLVRPIT